MVDSRFTPGGGGTSYQGRPDFEYNNLKQIEGLLQEVITDKTLSYHDSMFKIIIIGDSGIICEIYFSYRYRKILCTEASR